MKKRVNDQMQIDWTGGVNATQYLESSQDLTPENWTVLETLSPPTLMSNTRNILIENEGGTLFLRVRTTRDE